MAFRRAADPASKKTARITVLFSEGDMERLERVCAYYALTKSVAVHDMVMRQMADDLTLVDDATLAEAETRQETWREKLGLA